METTSFGTMVYAAKPNISALFELASNRLAELRRKNDQIVSVALLGGQHSGAKEEDYDPIAKHAFEVISDISGDVTALIELEKLLTTIAATTRT